MERGLNWGEYHDKDLVVVGKGSHSGEIGRVETRPGYETDLVHLGCLVVMIEPNNLRRVRPGDRVACI